jgi:hypothetical protein
MKVLVETQKWTAKLQLIIRKSSKTRLSFYKTTENIVTDMDILKIKVFLYLAMQLRCSPQLEKYSLLSEQT